MKERYIELLGEAAHEACRAFGFSIDQIIPPWNAAPAEMRKSVIDGVRGVLNGDTPQESHERWVLGKLEDGWVYGAVKDAEKKTHPCILPYEELPDLDRAKDHIFTTVVRVLAENIVLYGSKS